MKKILLFLGAIGISTTAAQGVVACNTIRYPSNSSKKISVGGYQNELKTGQEKIIPFSITSDITDLAIIGEDNSLVSTKISMKSSTSGELVVVGKNPGVVELQLTATDASPEFVYLEIVNSEIEVWYDHWDKLKLGKTKSYKILNYSDLKDFTWKVSDESFAEV